MLPSSASAAQTGETVNVWLTTADRTRLLAPQASVVFGPDSSTGLLLNMNENHRYQQMEGFGAALTDSSAWLIGTKLSEPQRSTLLDSLFGSSGIGLSYLRVPMGASDFVAGGAHYTYDDMPAGQTDPAMSHFSIAHDDAYIIPTLRRAFALSPNLKIVASPWTAPGWMKDGGSLIGGTLPSANYAAFASYFVKFIKAYRDAGIPLGAIEVQNEPQHLPADYPGMWMTAGDEANFVKGNLAPALASAGLSTRIIGLSHNWGFFPYADELLADAAARTSIAGVAFHCYGGRPEHMSRFHDAYPAVGIYFDECTAAGPTTDWGGDFGWDMQNLIIGAPRNWSKTIVKWNLALDTDNGPHLGGCGTCKGVVTIDRSTGAVSYNLDYYSLGHVSKFVRPGAYRIASSDLTGNSLSNVAFLNPDGSKALIVYNAASRSQTFKVRWGGASFQYSLPAKAAATFIWSGPQAAAGPPSAPTDLTATAGDGKSALQWTFSPLAGTYTVKRSASSSGPFNTLATGVRLPSYTDTAVTNGSSYFYRVSAVNSTGQSTDSSSVSTTPNPPSPRPAGSQIEAESFDAELGVALETCTDSGGGEYVGYAEDGNYIGWNSVDFGGGSYATVKLRVASGSSGGTIELRLGGPTGALLASLPVANTGGWQTWKTLKGALRSAPPGVQTLYVTFNGPSRYVGVANLNWITFSTR